MVHGMPQWCFRSSFCVGNVLCGDMNSVDKFPKRFVGRVVGWYMYVGVGPRGSPVRVLQERVAELARVVFTLEEAILRTRAPSCLYP